MLTYHLNRNALLMAFNMKDFFRVTDLDRVLEYRRRFPQVLSESMPLLEANSRVLAEDVIAGENLPEFKRAVMDGYAVQAASTYGASEGNPAYLAIKGSIDMGRRPTVDIGTGEAARISTGGMLPKGADSVVMLEHASSLDNAAIEVYRSVAPGQHVMEIGEDFQKTDTLLARGQMLRPQEIGLLAAFGRESASVFKKPVVGIISSGDEVVPVNVNPAPGHIRDVNTYTLSGMVASAGGIPVSYGITGDDYDALYQKCATALDNAHMLLISGGSSVGMRDFTTDVLSNLPGATILVHGISISPGKPTILADVRHKPVWGLPGQVTSAMVVFLAVVKPFIDYMGGLSVDPQKGVMISARLGRNVSSAQGRVDYIRVKLSHREGTVWADPILGKSGLLNTMVMADGLIKVGINTEGLEKGARIRVMPM